MENNKLKKDFKTLERPINIILAGVIKDSTRVENISDLESVIDTATIQLLNLFEYYLKEKISGKKA